MEPETRQDRASSSSQHQQHQHQHQHQHQGPPLRSRPGLDDVEEECLDESFDGFEEEDEDTPSALPGAGSNSRRLLSLKLASLVCVFRKERDLPAVPSLERDSSSFWFAKTLELARRLAS